MDDDNVINLNAVRMGSFKFSYVSPAFESIIFGNQLPIAKLPTYDVTIMVHYFRVRRRLVRLRPLMRRPRGRKMLGVTMSYEKLVFYGVKMEDPDA